MTPDYVPVLKAKGGEFEALKNLKPASLSKVRPVLEVPSLAPEKIQMTKKYRESATPRIVFLDTLAEQIINLPSNLTYHLDIRDWAPNSVTESGEHILSFLYRRLKDQGKPINPVVSYASWDDPDYQRSILHLPLTPDSKVGIRIEREDHEDFDDAEFFLEKIVRIVESLSLNVSQCGVIVDFGDLSTSSAIETQEVLEKVLSLLSSRGFEFVSLAGSSIPVFISEVVPEPNSDAIWLRKEVNAWKAVKQTHPASKLVFGDYGVRSPNSPDYAPNPNVNGKIRYTIPEHFYVIRGHSMQKGEKGGQFHGLARRLVSSQYFMNPNFSWGDQKAYECSTKSHGPGSQPGSLVKWLAYDTNHHAEAVLLEVFEFNHSLHPALRELI